MNIHYERGKVFFDLGRYEEAEQVFRLALDGSPNDTHTHRALSLCLCNLGRRQESRVEAENAIRTGPEFWLNHYALAACLAEFVSAKDWPGCAERAIRETLRFAPNDADTWGLLAYLRYVEDRWAEMLDAANSGLLYEPQHVDCLLHRAEALLAMNDLQEAENSARQALAAAPETSRAFAILGRIRLAQDRVDESEGYFLEALRIRPVNQEAQTRMRRGKSRWRRWVGNVLAYSQEVILEPPAKVKTPEGTADARLLAAEMLERPRFIERALGRVICFWAWLPRMWRPRAADEVTSISRLLLIMLQVAMVFAWSGSILLVSWPEVPQHNRMVYLIPFFLEFMALAAAAVILTLRTRSWMYRQLASSKWKRRFARFKDFGRPPAKAE